MEKNKRIYEASSKDDAIKSIVKKVEEAEGSKMQRICRSAVYEGTFYFTIIMENYRMVEVSLKAADFHGLPALDVDIEAF